MEIPGGSYEKRLQALAETIPGATSASLTGIDGIGIASYHVEEGLDPTLADAEFATMLGTASRAAQNLGVGEIGELIFTTDTATFILRMVGKEFYLGVGLAPGIGNLGMARLQMRWACDDFTKALL